MQNSECAICYQNLGKIHRVLQCGHRFHHKCIKACETSNAKIHKCPYCRQEYENICLRDRTKLLNTEEKKKKKDFTDYIRKYIDECQNTNGKKDKFLICKNVFKRIAEEKDMLSNENLVFKVY